MTGRLPVGLNVTLYPTGATWGALREFVRMAEAVEIPDDAELRCVFDINGDFEGITFGPEDRAADQ